MRRRKLDLIGQNKTKNRSLKILVQTFTYCLRSITIICILIHISHVLNDLPIVPFETMNITTSKDLKIGSNYFHTLAVLYFN